MKKKHYSYALLILVISFGVSCQPRLKLFIIQNMTERPLAIELFIQPFEDMPTKPPEDSPFEVTFFKSGYFGEPSIEENGRRIFLKSSEIKLDTKRHSITFSLKPRAGLEIFRMTFHQFKALDDKTISKFPFKLLAIQTLRNRLEIAITSKGLTENFQRPFFSIWDHERNELIVQ